MNSHPDIVVVGAGAAGISAAYTLLNLGLSVTVVEAAERIGGRCWTDTETFGIPFDVGAHWMHYGYSNFYLSYAKEHGFDVYPDPRRFYLYEKSKRLPKGFKTFGESHDKYWFGIQNNIDIKLDVSVSESTEHVISEDISDFICGPWTMGKETDEFSVFEYSSKVGGRDWFCREGFGSLVAHYGAALPVSLDTEVTFINWSGDGVKIETNRGAIHAEAVIVTVSTGVLASERIRFSPALPIDTLVSIHSVPMGCYEHVALQFAGTGRLQKADSYVIRVPDRELEGFGALLNVCGSDLVYCDIGGDIARDLIPQGEKAYVDYALEELVQIFGSAMRKRFIKGATTAWLSNPLSQGSYASAKPGSFHKRKVLREPVADRIFFAGEACHNSMWATVAGAHASGQEVAKNVAELLK